MKRIICALLVTVMALAATGCMSSIPEQKQPSAKSMPEVRPGPIASIGDSQTPRAVSAVVYLPDADSTKLSTQVKSVLIDSGQTKQEAYVNALLKQIEESDLYSGTQRIRLSPVSNAVETTGELVTVNLYRSLYTLPSAQAQFAVRMAIVNTLTELQGTSYVNILVDGRDNGLDADGNVPSGVMTRLAGNDITMHWNKMEAQRDGTASELQRKVALYFVTEEGNYILGEVRNLTFSQQDTLAYAQTLLTELSKGATSIAGARLVVPPQEWFEREPTLVKTENGTFVELYFYTGINDQLAMNGSTYGMLLSSICYTLTGFIPKLEGIIAYVGGNLVTRMELMNGQGWSQPNGQLTRESVAALAADVCKVYYPLDNHAMMYAVSRPIAQQLKTQPRALMRELLKEPSSPTVVLARGIPEQISDADILGIQVQNDVALINVTSHFADVCQGMSSLEERGLIYTIVNTLTEIEGITRVRIYVEGKQSQLAGHLFIGGEFLRHPGLIYTGGI